MASSSAHLPRPTTAARARFSPTFLTALTALALALVATTTARAEWQRDGQVWSRVVKHTDGTRTHSKQDVNTRILEESTFSEARVLVKRRLFQLGHAGQPKSGLIFDGKNNLVARILYHYDDYDELKEERVFNKQGQLIRRLVYGLGGGGGIKAKPVAFTYDPSAPKAAPVRSEESVDPVMPLGVKTGAGSGIPTSKPTGSTATPPPAATPEEKEKDKGGFFSRFRRK